MNADRPRAGDRAAGSGGSRRAYAKSAGRRDQILAAVLQVFTRMGYNSGTVRAVATRAGMAEASVLHHFPSKSALLAALLEEREVHTRSSLANAEDALEALLLAVDFQDDQTKVYAELFTRLAAEATDSAHPAHEFVSRRYDTVRRDLTGAFIDLKREGRLRPGVIPSSAAKLVVAAWEGLLLQWLIDNSSVKVQRELRVLIGLLVVVEHPERQTTR